mmetsp:Transcript_83346/g.139070  ORF Transcript_83346/g.139070 Transcript_83346/m.139070 type:complete len:212 (+) Transcript_83346:1001-1636(+)
MTVKDSYRALPQGIVQCNDLALLIKLLVFHGNHHKRPHNDIHLRYHKMSRDDACMLLRSPTDMQGVVIYHRDEPGQILQAIDILNVVQRIGFQLASSPGGSRSWVGCAAATDVLTSMSSSDVISQSFRRGKGPFRTVGTALMCCLDVFVQGTVATEGSVHTMRTLDVNCLDMLPQEVNRGEGPHRTWISQNFSRAPQMSFLHMQKQRLLGI